MLNALSKVLVAALMLWAAPVFAAWTFVAQTTAVGSASCSEDISNASPVSMTGANTLFVIVSVTNTAADPNPGLTDNVGGNTYTKILRSANVGSADVILYRVASANVSGSMTFTLDIGETSCPSFVVLGFSGGHATPDDLTQSNSVDATTSVTAGAAALTPSECNCLVIAGLAAVAVGDTVTINGGYSTVYQQAGVSSVAHGVAAAYLIQVAAAATNPTFSWTTSNDVSTLLGSFKSAAGCGSGAPRSNLLLLGVQ